jgi:Flp pilus assembly CpaE family ATPase
MAVNFAVDVVRVSKKRAVIVDIKPGLGEVSLFLGVRSRYTLLDALDNLHRLDGEFLRELVVKHNGLEILAGSDPSIGRRGRCGHGRGGLPAARAAMRMHLIDAGRSARWPSPVPPRTRYLVANGRPGANAQRLLDRVRQLGACGERVRILLNRAAEPYPIPPKQIEAALGHPIHHTFPSDYKTVSNALNSGVPLALTGDSDIAAQFDSFTRHIIAPRPAGGREKRSRFSFERLSSR